MPDQRFDHPRLIADVGGTYARFALEVAPHVFDQGQSLRCADFADFHAAVTAYLGGLHDVDASLVRHAAIAIANPVAGDDVRMTNYHWRFSIEQMRQRLGLDNLVVVNDFTALAMAVPSLRGDQRRQLALVQVERVGANVDEARHGPAQHKGVDGRHKGEGRHNHFVAGAGDRPDQE